MPAAKRPASARPSAAVTAKSLGLKSGDFSDPRYREAYCEHVIIKDDRQLEFELFTATEEARVLAANDGDADFYEVRVGRTRHAELRRLLRPFEDRHEIWIADDHPSRSSVEIYMPSHLAEKLKKLGFSVEKVEYGSVATDHLTSSPISV